jgi:hypothetical protein
MTRSFGLASILLCLPLLLWGQASNSTVRGTVRDQAQAVIPSAKVSLSNTNTNVSRLTLSNEAGCTCFPA